jgi:NAD(P)H-dependent FMN reductase
MQGIAMERPYIVGIGGTTPGSSTEQALKLTLASAEREGARVRLFGSATLSALPHYLTPAARDSEEGRELVDHIRAADGLILASPACHGSISSRARARGDSVTGGRRRAPSHGRTALAPAMRG